MWPCSPSSNPPQSNPPTVLSSVAATLQLGVAKAKGERVEELGVAGAKMAAAAAVAPQPAQLARLDVTLTGPGKSLTATMVLPLVQDHGQREGRPLEQ